MPIQGERTHVVIGSAGDIGDTGKVTLTAEGTISKYELVQLGTAAHSCVQSGISDTPIGVALEDAVSDDYIVVYLLNRPGSVFMIASGAIGVGAIAYAAAAGKIDTSGGRPVGICLEAGAADGDVIEVVSLLNPTALAAAGGGAVDEDQNVLAVQVFT